MACAAGIGFEAIGEKHLMTTVRKERYANGLAIIVTNDYNGCPGYQPLEGTYADFVYMEDAFMDLNFAPFRVENKSSRLLATIMRVVASFKHYPPSYHMLAFAFSGHGSDDGAIIMQDGEKLYIEELIQQFQPGNALEMAHWPKMFFIDACRGKIDMKRVPLPKGGGEKLSCLLVPEEGNMLIAYSTAPRCQAYDRQDKGGCWFPFLAKKLKEMDASVTDVLTEVNKEVFACFQDYPGAKIQQPHYESSLHRNVFLRREANDAKLARGKLCQCIPYSTTFNFKACNNISRKTDRNI